VHACISAQKILRIVGQLLTLELLYACASSYFLVTVSGSSIARVSYKRTNLYNCIHLLRTDHVSPNKLVDIVEVPGFRDSAVVIAVRQLFPHHDLGFAQAEELLHVAWSVASLAFVSPN